jgi:hypothetical protein
VQLITHLAQGKFNIYITTRKQSLLESTEITKENDSFIENVTQRDKAHKVTKKGID